MPLDLETCRLMAAPSVRANYDALTKELEEANERLWQEIVAMCDQVLSDAAQAEREERDFDQRLVSAAQIIKCKSLKELDQNDWNQIKLIESAGYGDKAPTVKNNTPGDGGMSALAEFKAAKAKLGQPKTAAEVAAAHRDSKVRQFLGGSGASAPGRRNR